MPKVKEYIEKKVKTVCEFKKYHECRQFLWLLPCINEGSVLERMKEEAQHSFALLKPHPQVMNVYRCFYFCRLCKCTLLLLEKLRKSLSTSKVIAKTLQLELLNYAGNGQRGEVNGGAYKTLIEGNVTQALETFFEMHRNPGTARQNNFVDASYLIANLMEKCDKAGTLPEYSNREFSNLIDIPLHKIEEDLNCNFEETSELCEAIALILKNDKGTEKIKDIIVKMISKSSFTCIASIVRGSSESIKTIIENNIASKLESTLKKPNFCFGSYFLNSALECIASLQAPGRMKRSNRSRNALCPILLI